MAVSGLIQCMKEVPLLLYDISDQFHILVSSSFQVPWESIDARSYFGHFDNNGNLINRLPALMKPAAHV